ncbi:hypothetical protein FEM48_Zijuj04G0201200 [Ziziphus jujuba var. spinosa]|uniref:Bulb-type lectin domain-containing protein n=1 Tax=Ziziphus jujuba var. spinosa TaxID=714518 RepID=A0A978VLX9_ZIZJJ|nr:hypothetical protein FEM48_Zijuj04G0201200 [Ziziphus jujuba var. spinosa]
MHPPAFFTNRSQLSVFHVSSSSTVWSTDNPPLSTPAKLSLTHNGLSISNDSDYVFWSTPKLESSVFALRLFDDGNLVLLDDKNGSLWQSFDNPTDTVVPGQRLAIGKALSAGRYRLTLTGSDALLQWNGLTYWKLSMDIKAYRDSNAGVASMALNNSGFYLFASDGSTVVFQVKLDGPAGFRIARMGLDGKFTISNFIASKWVVEFLGPFDQCQIPLICGRLGLCKPRPPTSVTCSCLRGFRSSNGGYSDNGECKPIETSVSLPSGCDSITNNGSISYLKLDDEIDYFANDFVQPVKRDVSVSVCKDLCSKNCSCMGIFHGSSSGSCYFLQNPLGSIMSRFGKKDRLGYIKTLAVHSPENPDRKGSKFPVYGSVLISSFGFLLIVIVVGILWLRRNRVSKGANPKLNRSKSASSGELEAISIAGLPVSAENDHSSGGHGASPSSGIVYFPLLALEMHEQRRYLELADPRVEGRVSAEQVEMLVRIALCCVNEEPALRPSMVNVVGMLEGRVPLDEPRIQKLNFLRSYGRLFTEASKMEAFSKQNEFEMFTKFDTMFNSGTSGSYNSLSYISSQDVSGPR